MLWRRPRSRGLLLPEDRRALDRSAVLAQDLRSLWVPGQTFAGTGIVNLAPLDQYYDAITFAGAGQTPAWDETVGGPALRFDGVDDIAVRQAPAFAAIPFIPNNQIANTFAVAFRLDSQPSDERVVAAFSSSNVDFLFELRIGAGQTRLVYQISGNSTIASIAATPTTGAVAMVTAVLDSYGTARIALWEPDTGRFLTGQTTSGTITPTDAANQFDYEVIGGSYGGDAGSAFAPITLLDSWFWSRALPEDDLALWRMDRWSVLEAPTRRIVSLAAGSSYLQAAQTVSTPFPNQVGRALARATHAGTVPVPSQLNAVINTTASQRRLDQTDITLDSVAVLLDGSGGTGGQYRLDEADLTLDGGSVHLDGSGATTPPSAPAATWDQTGLTLDSFLTLFDGSTPASGFAASNVTLAPPTQTALAVVPPLSQGLVTVPVPAQAAAARVIISAQSATVLPLPSQFAAIGAPVTWDRTSPTFDTTTVRFDGSAVAVTGAQSNIALAAPAQTAAGGVLARALASQVLPAVPQTATGSAPNPGSANLIGLQLVAGLVSGGAASGSAAPLDSGAPTLDSGSVRFDTGASPVTLRTVAGGRAAQAVIGPQTTAQVVTARDAPFGFAFQILEAPSQVARGFVPVAQTPSAGPTLPDIPVEAPYIPPATGDLEDMIDRQAAVLPPWFGAPGTVPAVLRLPLSMAGAVGSYIYDLIGYAKLQTRLKTATGGWLDLAAFDFFGRRIRRREGQGDESFRRRILIELFRPRATRPAMISVLRDATGVTPRIFEPARPEDSGAWGAAGGMGYGASGVYGSTSLPGTAFIDVFRRPDAGIPYAAGYGTPAAGYGTGSRAVYSSLEQITGQLTDADIYATVEATRPAGVVTWVRISYAEPSQLEDE